MENAAAAPVPVSEDPKDRDDWAVGELGWPAELKNCKCAARIHSDHAIWKVPGPVEFANEDADPAVFRRLKPGKTGGNVNLGDQRQRIL